MGKAERIRRMNAREKIAAQQAAAQRAEARKRMFLASGSVLGVLVIVIVLIIVKSATSPSAPPTSPVATPAQAAAVTKQLTTVPASTLNAVGMGSTAPLVATKSQPELTSGGKPEILFVGAEYCPYCAAERWAIAVALSRFGTLSNLRYIHSSSTDTYPDTPTLSFYKASYTSNYVAFSSVELYSTKETSPNVYATLQKPTTAELALMGTYDAPPYVQSSAAGTYPWLDIGNQYLDTGALYQPSTLAHLSWAQVAAAIKDPNSAVAKGVDGAANAITAAICKISKNAPAAVCTSPAALAGAGSL